jgi:hypothetical protein
MFLKLKHVTGPMVINTALIIAMSPNSTPQNDGTIAENGTDIDLVDDKNITVLNAFDDIWYAMKNPGRTYREKSGIQEIEGANGPS